MRLKALLIVTALAGVTALPATAQGYGYSNSNVNCRERGENRAGGAVLGAIVGGVLGSNVAGRGHRGDGTALGAVLGGVVGSEVGRASTPCAVDYGRQDYPAASYPATSYPAYPQQSYPQTVPGTYSPYSAGSYPPAPPADYGYYPSGSSGGDDRYYEGEYDNDRGSRNHRDGVYGKGNRSYNRTDDYAGRDCDDAVQITRLPDGTEIRRPVEACRDAYYGDWRVKD
jgi:glycine zipper 2TM protein